MTAARSPAGRFPRGLAVLLLACACGAQAVDAPDAAAAQVETLLKQMTLEEKVSLMAGNTEFTTPAIPRLGIPALRMADGPNGIRSNETDPATVFPSSVALSSTWNRALVREVSSAIGEEATALNYQMVLAPAMNIQRTPLGGRNFEYFSEDPYLTGQIGASFVRGLQGVGVGATPKHFAANNQEHERKRASSNVSERALREIYTSGFETVVTSARPWAMMTGYNRLNGVYTSEHRWLLTDLLKGEWGFGGVLMSDWGAVHSTEASALNGLDLEMPGPPEHYGDKLVQAVRSGKVPESAVDDSARRVLGLMFRTGLLPAGVEHRPGVLGGQAHEAISRRAATEAMVLLKNQGQLLPLDRNRIRTLAVIGPNADARVIQGGGSSEVLPLKAVTGLEGLKALLGDAVKVEYARGADNDRFAPTADPRMFSPTRERSAQGLRVQYWTHGKIEGSPAVDRLDQIFQRFYFGFDLSPAPQDDLAIRWSGYFWPPVSGEYTFNILDKQNITLSLDGKPLLKRQDAASAPPMYDFLKWKERKTKIRLEAGKAYAIQMDFLPGTRDFLAYRVGILPPPGDMQQAVELAARADAAIVFVGSSNTSESEGQDRQDMSMIGNQDELVRRVAQANPRTVVVLNNGGPMAMPWLDQVPAVLEAWFLGGETGNALADVLFGNANPSGKLPMSFPRRVEDNPTNAFYPGGLEADYGEGIYVGYRWYEKNRIPVAFPFGHGLSYTTFSYGALKLSAPDADGRIRASMDISNAGVRAGSETVQLYVAPPADGESRPVKELRGFSKVALAPGEHKVVEFQLERRAFAYFDVRRHGWSVPAGRYQVQVGASSADIRGTAAVQVDPAFMPVAAPYKD